jgi:GGDEF domain-containing protein
LAVLDQTEVKGVPPGLTGEPLEKTPVAQPKQVGAVKGVPAGLIGEAIAPTESPKPADAPKQNKPLDEYKQAQKTVQEVKGVPEGLTAHLIPMTTPRIEQFRQAVKPAREKIYDETLAQGYSPRQASQRQQEYDYAVKNGMNPERAMQFASTLEFDSAEKKDIAPEAKANVSAYVLSQTQEAKNAVEGYTNRLTTEPPTQEQTELYMKSHDDPNAYAQKVADSYAYARSRGWDENKAMEYANASGISRAATQVGDWVGPKWTGFKSSLLKMIGAKDTDHVSPQEAAEAPLVASLGGQTARDYSFNVYKDASWVDEHIGRTIGSAEAHLDNLIAGFTTPDMAAIELASFGTSTLAEGGIGGAAEVAEEGAAASRAQRIGKTFGSLAKKTIPAAGAERVVSATESAERAVKAVQEARVPVSIQSTARNIQRLAHAGFTAQMAVGTEEAAKAAYKSHTEGDNSEAMGYVLDGLVSGLMTYGGIKHLAAETQLREDLEGKTSEVYPEKRFGKLNDQEQAVVIDKLITDDPRYKSAADASEKEQVRNAKKLAYRYDAALRQAWNPDAAKRAVRLIDDHRRQEAILDEFRTHYLKQIDEQLAIQKELEEAEAERREIGKEKRPEKRSEAAKQREEARKVTLATAEQVQKGRESVSAARDTHEQDLATHAAEEAARQSVETSAVTRTPDEVRDEEGHVAYRGFVIGADPDKPDEQTYGPAQNKDGQWGIYRNGPAGLEYLGADGTWAPNPESGQDFETPRYFAPNERTAKTFAQINAMRISVDYDLEKNGSSPDREAERRFLRDLEGQLLEGDVDGDQARKTANLPEEAIPAEKPKPTATQEIEAARSGVLNGPLHEKTRAQYEADFRVAAEEAGWDQADTDAYIAAFPVEWRSAAENNLHYVSRSGDWIASKKGLTWVLDSKGMLRVEDGSRAPIPLMKNGRYTAQAIDLSMSGRVGFGQRSWEDAAELTERHNKAEQQLEDLTNKVAEEVQFAIEISKQNAGLALLPGEPVAEPSSPNRKSSFAPPAPELDMYDPERETQRAVEAGHAAEKAADRETTDAWINAMGDYMADHHEDAWGIIKRIAKNSGMSPQEVVRLQMERMAPTDTVDGKIASLKVGDTISDKMRLPWVVERDAKGNLYLRSGDSQRVPLNPFKPSDTVRRIMTSGELMKAPGPRYTLEDIRKVAFEAPYVAKREASIEEVKARASGETRDPEPVTPGQAEGQAAAAKERAEDVKGAAIVDTVKASDPTPGTTVEQADAAVDKAEETKQTAEQAEWQKIQAKAKTYEDKPFPPRAPISMGERFTGNAVTIKHLGQDFGAHYALVSLDSLVNSHVWDGNTLVLNPEYDEALQPRTISEGRSSELVLEAQLRESGSRGYDFDYYGDRTISPLTGPAIVDDGGRVAGGNTRIAIMRKHLEILRQMDNPEMRDIALLSFRTRMAQLARENGIPGMPQDGRDYAVVRILDSPITTYRDAALKGMFFNSSPSTDITEAAKGVALARQLTDSTLTDIGVMLDKHDTLGAAIAASPKVFADIVRNELGVPSTENTQWFVPDKDILSESGRRKFAQVLMGRIFQDTSVMSDLGESSPSAYSAIEKASINIIRMKATKNEPMVDKIIQAVHAAATTATARIEGETNVDRWATTYSPEARYLGDMGTNPPPEPDKVTEAIWRAIYGGPRTLSDRVKEFNATDRPSLGTRFAFDTDDEAQKLETPTELFNRVFKKEITAINFRREKSKNNTITEAEYNAAMENRGNLSDQEVKEAERVEQGLPPEERRKSEMAALRGRIDKMSPEEKNRAIEQLHQRLHTDELTGLPNKAAFDATEEQGKAAVIGVSDMAGLKAFNDEYGQAAGDKALKAMGEALKRAGLEAYRIHGDEIAYRAGSEEQLRSKLEEARTILKNTGIAVEKAGVHDTLTGVDISYGMGKDYAEADKAMSEAKKTRKTKRGEFGDIKATGKMEPPPAMSSLEGAKREVGFVTPDNLKDFIESHESTREHAAEIMRTARMMADYVYDLDPPEGVEKRDALAWVLQERLAGLESSEDSRKAGSFRTAKGEERFGKGILALHKAANPTTFLHEFAHVIFPLLSEDDMKAIDTLMGRTGRDGKPLFPKWDGKRGTLTGDVFTGVSEKFAGGLERFLRDQNPTGFSAEVKNVLAKIKDMFVKFYNTVAGDPLSDFAITTSTEAKRVYADIFGIKDFDAPDDFKKNREAARKEEAKQKHGMVKPEEQKHPVQLLATEYGASGVRKAMDGAIIESYGDRVDPNKPTVVLFYPNIEAVASAAIKIGDSGAAVQGADLIQAPDGSYGLRVNVKGDVPENILYQDVPQRHPGLELQDLEAKLAKTPESTPMLRKFLETRINQLKSQIRSQYGADTPKFGPDAETARKAIAEVKRERTSEAGRPRVSDLRGVPDEPSRVSKPQGTGRLSKPPVMGMPGHAGAPRAADKPRTSLTSVKPVTLIPFDRPRLEAVGILAGDKFDEKVWRDGLRKAGLPETIPPPTVPLSREVAQVLKFAGQKQIVQMVLSALEQGDGAVIASSTGTGKTYTSGAIIKETLLKNPNAKILLITKNRGLLKSAAKIGKESFSYDMQVDAPTGALDKNVYGASYQRLLGNPIYAQTQWDLVIADESGEARNWHAEDNQQGKLLMAVMQNSKKGVYVSATPFHSPNEYGYLEKLNLWPKGQFQNWIKDNFAHEKIGDKIVAKLDPSKQAKFRQQLIERGQMVSQEISYDGFTVHFGVVPIDDVIERKLDRIHQGIAVARRELLAQGKKGLAERIAAFEATYTKAFLERSRLPQAIELARKALDAGWHPLFFSETTSEDLFRRPVGPKEEPGTYRKLDDESGGLISRIMPEFPNIMDELRSAFGDQIGDYSGLENTDAQREENKAAYLKGDKPMLYTSYAAGGIGVSLHDEDGDKPRFSIFLGPPYSGVLLEQAMGRTWRFGVKSNAMAVFLATDSEPDIRLMATKVGPRMRALRASVLGERDSLAAVMAGYSDEQKMREQQDLLAFDQGNEVKVDAQNFQVRSKRKVNFDNWSAITVPSAEGAKNKGMQVEMSGGKGDDWTTLYQEKPKRWEPPNRPLTIEDLKIRRAINAAADEAAKNPQIPSGEIGMAAVRAKIQAEGAPEDVDKEAAARDVIVAHLKGIGYTQDPLTGEYKTAEQIEPTEIENPTKDQTYRAALGLTSSQEQNLIYMDRQMSTGGAGRELVTKTRRYTAIDENQTAELRTEFSKIMRDSGLNPHDEKVMRDIFDVVMNKRAVADPYINKAASQIRPMMARIQLKGAAENLSTITPDGRLIPWKDFNPDPSYMPRMADWDAKFTDGTNTYTLREIMGEGFGEERAKRLIEEKFKKEGRTDVTADAAFLAVERTRLRAPRRGNIHYTNEVNFPFIRKDLGALDNYFRQFAKAVATEREFGSDLGKLRKEIAKIPNERARTDVEHMFGYMFTPQNWDANLGKFYNFMSGAESWTKMTFSATKVLYHAGNLHTVLSGRVMPVASAVGHTFLHWREARDNAYMIGTIMEGVDPALMNLPETKSQRYAFKATGFEKLYNLGRVIAGETARSYLDKYAMKDLKKGGKSEENTRRLLRNTFLIGDAAINKAMETGKWGEEEYKLAQVGFANESMYGKNPLQMPKAARRRISGQHMDTFDRRLNMALRASYSLQSFSVKTYSMLREHLWDEVMIHHNYKPLAYAMIITPIIGQMLQGTGAGAKHFVKAGFEKARGREHEEDSWDKWLAQFTDIKDKPAAALLKIYIDGLCSQWALERTKRLADAMLNIAIGDKPSLKSAKATGMYLLNDEIEQDIGPIWVDTVMRPIKFAGEEIEAGAGKAGTFVGKSFSNFVHNTMDAYPLLRNSPDIEDLTKKKATGSIYAPPSQ